MIFKSQPLFYAALGLAAFVVINQGNMVPASASKPYFASQSECESLAHAMGPMATCKYVQAPESLVVSE